MQITQSLSEVRSDELRKKINGIRVQVWRVLYPSAQDILVDLDGRSTVPKRRESTQHFENQDSERPPFFAFIPSQLPDMPEKLLGSEVNKTYQSTDLL